MLTKKIAGGAALVFSLAAPLHRLHAMAEPRLLAQASAAAGATPGAGKTAYFAGLRSGNSQERRRHFSAGISAARARLAANPDDPEGLLWLAANLGGEALERGKLVALRVLPEMERLLLRLDASAPGYDNAAAARTLGRLYHLAPAFISIGSMKKARKYWERALQLAADYPANLVLAADFYAADGDQGRARKLAQRYLAAPVSPEEHPEANEWRAIAERIVRDTGQGR